VKQSVWHKSSYSGESNCVEVNVGDTVLVRHSGDPTGPILRFTTEEWEAFAKGLKDGEFD